MSAVAMFEYFETLGEGVAGVVYRAKDGKGREVAVKLLRETAAKNPELLRRFKREVDIATQLEHENLVLAYEGGETAAGRLYLACEFVRGCNAGRLLEANRPLSEAAALSVGRDVARALGFLASKQLVHRDVKPENVLVRQDGLGKLSDFGLARSAQPGGARLTATGEVVGTPYYLAPEQIQARGDVDIRADLYSLGCMMWEWLAGKRPFDGASIVEILAGHVKSAAPALADQRPGLHEKTYALVKRLLEKDRTARFPAPIDAERAMTDALQAIGWQSGGSPAGAGKEDELARETVKQAVARVPSLAPTAAPRSALGMTGTISSADATSATGLRSARWKLKIGAARGTLTLFVFGGDRLTLGRDSIDKSENDVCLRVRGQSGDAGSRKISGSHMRVEIDAKGAQVKDLESTGGTRLNGVKLQPRTPTLARTGARIDVASALELDVRVTTSETAGAPPAAVVLTRPTNGSDQAYALVREKLLIDGSTGEVRVGGPIGTIVGLSESRITLNGQPIEPGKTIKASGLTIETSEIRPEDMK